MGKKTQTNTKIDGPSSKKGKRALEYEVNPRLAEKSFIEKMRRHWKTRHSESSEFSDDHHTFLRKPFPCCQLRDFLSDESNLDYLVKELVGLDYVKKNNDLYKFVQSSDLNDVDSLPCIEAFKRLLYDQILKWMIEVTEIELEDARIDIFAARYNHTDYLLCHDDELEGRRIAFIYYLVPRDWSEADGGSLDLFDRDDEGQPKSVVKSLLPRRNSFSFFEVSHLSFHQVSEVLSKDKTRLSISGWYRGKSLPGPPSHVEILAEPSSPIDIEDENFFSWINPVFLSPENQGDIQDTFGEKSEISLQKFLAEDKFQSVKEALKLKGLQWKKVGPANRRNYDVLSEKDSPAVVKSLIQFLRSDAMFLFLSNITGIKFHPLFKDDDDDEEEGTETSEEVKAKCRYEIRRWRRGSYTLVHDEDERSISLDARIFFCADEWNDERGGVTSYIARDEDEELMSISPTENSLLLVYKDEETLKFVKYINSDFDSTFFDVDLSYYEK